MRLYLACLALRLVTATAASIDLAHLYLAAQVQIIRRRLVRMIEGR